MKEKEPKEWVPFNCPYCGVEVRGMDIHGEKIERKGMREPSITVTCTLVRVFSIDPKEVK